MADQKDTLTTIADGLTGMRKDALSMLSKFGNADDLSTLSKWTETKAQMDKIDVMLNRIIDKVDATIPPPAPPTENNNA